jgi:predicted O-methyltransferase YrrM
MDNRLTGPPAASRSESHEAGTSAAAPATMRSLEQTIRQALHEVRDELPGLRFLPERRYDRSVFPTVGQYDWLAGQVLYALVRAERPRTVIEFSTSSGYSTSFIARALEQNGQGVLHTVDIDIRAQQAAASWLERNQLGSRVRMHTGDCRDVVPTLLSDPVDLLFIDTLHSFDIAEWYFAQVIPRLRPDTLVHIHDVMPGEARVRIHGGPPYPLEPAPARPPLMHLVKRFFWLMLQGRFPNPFPERAPREMLPLHSLAIHPPASAGELPSIDGNYFEEAVLVRELLAQESPADAVYLHRLHSVLAADEPMRYAPQDLIQRTDSFGKPLEWNDALWCRASTLQRVSDRKRVRALVRQLRQRHYGRGQGRQ